MSDTQLIEDWMRADRMRSAIEHEADKLVALAQAFGLVVTIERTPLQPLAMGNHAPKVTVWPDRKLTQ